MKAPVGDQFLPEIGMEKLKELYKKEKNPKARDRLLAYMARKKGDTIDRIAGNLSMGAGTIHDWLAKANNSLDSFYDIKRKGPTRRLTEEQLAELKEDLIAGPQENGFESSLWTGKMVAKHVKNKYGVDSGIIIRSPVVDCNAGISSRVIFRMRHCARHKLEYLDPGTFWA